MTKLHKLALKTRISNNFRNMIVALMLYLSTVRLSLRESYMPPLPPHLVLVLVASSLLAGALAALAILIATHNKEMPEKPGQKSTSGDHPTDDLSGTAIAQNPEALGGALLQTLTKTIAHLSVGIAIFDKDGRMVLFNPALMELSSLPLDLLTKRPRLFDFFDQLRTQGILPEPKDYAKWRNQYMQLGNNAPDLLEELWSLPSGLTYRVTAQSLRNGNMSLMIEDISNELSATRGIRARVRQNECILNSIDEPLCVFSGTGHLSFSNRAFKERWGTPETRSVGKMNDAISRWKAQTTLNANWGKLAAFSEQLDHRNEWSFDAAFLDGDSYSVRVNPVTGGGTMLRFLRQDAMDSLFETAQSRLQVDGARSIFATDGKAI